MLSKTPGYMSFGQCGSEIPPYPLPPKISIIVLLRKLRNLISCCCSRHLAVLTRLFLCLTLRAIYLLTHDIMTLVTVEFTVTNLEFWITEGNFSFKL